jgi:hypothetical protein
MVELMLFKQLTNMLDCSHVADFVQGADEVFEVSASFSRLVVDDLVGFCYDLLVSEKIILSVSTDGRKIVAVEFDVIKVATLLVHSRIPSARASWSLMLGLGVLALQEHFICGTSSVADCCSTPLSSGAWFRTVWSRWRFLEFGWSRSWSRRKLRWQGNGHKFVFSWLGHGTNAFSESLANFT